MGREPNHPIPYAQLQTATQRNWEPLEFGRRNLRLRDKRGQVSAHFSALRHVHGPLKTLHSHFAGLHSLLQRVHSGLVRVHGALKLFAAFFATCTDR